jgi:protein TonB
MTARAVLLPDPGLNDDIRQWVLSAAIVLAAHGGILATYFLIPDDVTQGAPQAPAIIIDMAPEPVAPASQLDLAPGPEMVEAQPTHTEPPPPEPEVLEPLPRVDAPAEVTLPIQEPKPKPIEEKPPEKPELAKPEAPKIEMQAPAPQTTAAPRSDRQDAPTPRAPSVGSIEQRAALMSWRDMVVARLQQSKRYPAAAEAKREQGTTTLSFSVDRNGKVLSSSIARSSGHPALDQEVLALVQRAQPLPAFPAAMTQSTIQLTVPIRFSLR